MSGESSDAVRDEANVLDVDLAERHLSPAPSSTSDPVHIARALNNAWSDVTRISSTAASSIAAESVRFFDGYEVLEELARGGMGVVYRARRLQDGQLVAVKMILSGQFAGEADLRRFHSETESVSRLNHPGIVPIFEVGEFQGRPYFSMELLEGRSLAQMVDGGPLGPREAADMVRRIAEAVQYAHERGVIHRDLKPKNILLDGAGQPKITDFGLAKRLNNANHLTATGEVVGTPSYMPPEQALGEAHRIGPTSDVYSLGAMLYCLLTGRPPFLAPTWMDTLLQVRERDPAPPSLLQPTIPAALEAICLKCLEKSPEDRYPTAQALVDDLGRYLADAPSEGRRSRKRPFRLQLARVTREQVVMAAGALFLGSSLLYGAWAVSNAVFEARDYAARAMQNAAQAERRATEAERRATEAERRAEALEAPHSFNFPRRATRTVPNVSHQAATDEPSEPEQPEPLESEAIHDPLQSSHAPSSAPVWASSTKPTARVH